MPSFPQMWLAAVERAPDRVAVEPPGGRPAMTYAELHRAAVALAGRLADAGVGPGHLVGLRMTGREGFCAALIAAWLADAVPVPLAAAAPDSYVEGIEQRIGVAVTVAGSIDADARIVGRASERHPRHPGLAYVMHTSGSTGSPKPVALSHRAVASYCRAFVQATGLGENDRFLQLAPITFDVVFEELLPIWSVGGTAVLAADAADDPRRLLHDIEARAVTVAELTTVYWQLLVRHLRAEGARVPTCLRLVLMGGEAAPCDLIRESLERGLPLAHVYGITETAITSTIAFFEPGQPVSASWVGPPLSNTAIVIVDEAGSVAADGEVGEVWIGGEGLAEGYLGDPEATARRFIDATLGSLTHQRWYRTGDAGRVVEGSLEIVGRLDAQVKVDGVRVDLTEIEMALRALPMVAEAAVLPLPGPGPTRLVGFVTAAVEVDEDLAARLRDGLRQRLPTHLVPARIVVLDALPVTPHGKIDRQRLAGVPCEVEAVQPAGAAPTERLVAAAWTAALGRPPRDPDERFFDAGGTSLDLLSLVVALEASGITVTPTDCLAHPTVRAMAKRIDGTATSDDGGSAERDAERRRRHLARRRMARSCP